MLVKFISEVGEDFPLTEKELHFYVNPRNIESVIEIFNTEGDLMCTKMQTTSGDNWFTPEPLDQVADKLGYNAPATRH